MLYDVPEWDEKLLDEWEAPPSASSSRFAYGSKPSRERLELGSTSWMATKAAYPQPTTSESLLTRPRKLERRMTTSRTCELVRAATSTRSHKFDGKALERGYF